jgi:hypothetical protein
MLCALKNQDKNNQMCMHCDKRLDYVKYLEKELSFAMTNTDVRRPSPGISALSRRVCLLRPASEGF